MTLRAYRLAPTILAVALISSVTPAFACSSYEREVAQLSIEAEQFRGTPDFKRWGFAKAGPYNAWLQRQQSLMDHAEAQSFFFEHGFNPAQVYLVAMEVRKDSGLDDFWADVDKEIHDLIEACGQ